jgi:hypothetical protein
MMMRNFPGELEPHVNGVCSALFYLFRSAPDSIAVRRELLAATRYVLTGPQKSACFAGVIDDVLAEGVLLGSSMASMEALRPLSVSVRSVTSWLQAAVSVASMSWHCSKWQQGAMPDSVVGNAPAA